MDKIELTKTDIETLETISIITLRNKMEIYITGLRFGYLNGEYETFKIFRDAEIVDKRGVFKIKIS